MHECGFFSLSRTQDTLLFISECLTQELPPLTSVPKRTHIVNRHLLSTTSYQNINKKISLYLLGSISSPDFIWKRVDMRNNSFFGVQKRIIEWFWENRIEENVEWIHCRLYKMQKDCLWTTVFNNENLVAEIKLWTMSMIIRFIISA